MFSGGGAAHWFQIPMRSVAIGAWREINRKTSASQCKLYQPRRYFALISRPEVSFRLRSHHRPSNHQPSALDSIKFQPSTVNRQPSTVSPGP
eukprot:944554-Rhodomonas_salina.1